MLIAISVVIVGCCAAAAAAAIFVIWEVVIPLWHTRTVPLGLTTWLAGLLVTARVGCLW